MTHNQLAIRLLIGIYFASIQIKTDDIYFYIFLGKEKLMDYQKNLAFLKKYPNLHDWLNLHGFSLIYSVRQNELQQIYSVWSDRSSQPTEDGYTDAKHWLTIVYCEECQSIEVYNRVTVCQPSDDRTIDEALDTICKDAYQDNFKDSYRDLPF